ncbi:Uncharacterised protein [Moraxella caprae]|uniref:Uncharacterized protein n=1 Tax=Moraxella caprae TaxID=90240 RepID=A0A378QW48_9GAMM|nr:Uncharacterised protein [Moraxella caprae]
MRIWTHKPNTKLKFKKHFNCKLKCFYYGVLLCYHEKIFFDLDGHIMSAPNYYLHWINLFLLIAKPITTDNPLAKGWCVYTEAVDFD